MNKSLITIILNCVSIFAFSQIEDSLSFYREINEQIFNTNMSSKSCIHRNKWYQPPNGAIKKEIISYSSGTQIVNDYNIKGSLIQSEFFKNGILKSTYNYEYGHDGITLLKERGVNKLDYTNYYNDEYSQKYYVVQATKEKQGLF